MFAWLPAVRRAISDDAHYAANGFFNGWYVDVDTLCRKELRCIRNADGTYDLPLVAEFAPQRLYVGALAVSAVAALALLSATLFKRAYGGPVRVEVATRRSAWRPSRRRLVRIASLFLVIVAWAFVPPVYASFASIFLIWTAFDLDVRVIIGGAAAVFAAIPVLLAFGKTGSAEDAAVYVFILLAISAVLQAFELPAAAEPPAVSARGRPLIRDIIPRRRARAPRLPRGPSPI
jgi:hypothetical protein